MNTFFRLLTIAFLLVLNTTVFAQTELKIANIRDFQTTSGESIKDLKVAYRTIGKLNAGKSNAVLWPSWFTGTSEQVINYGLVNKLLDSDELFIVVVDALGNGVSSSPSNTKNFPEISIRDMVNSQHKLLTEEFGIEKLKAIIGISMGGMQTYEWLVAYPDFMEKAIAIIGTPKQSSFDKLLWQTQIDLLENAGNNSKKQDFAMKRATDIFTMNLTSPAFMGNTVKPEDELAYMDEKYAQMMHPKDYLANLKAIINHDIYRSSKPPKPGITQIIKAKMLVVVNKQDHVVNPLAAIDLAKNTGSSLLIMDEDMGHTLPFFEHKKIKEVIVPFLGD